MEWEESEVRWATRWDAYLSLNESAHAGQIHWSAVGLSERRRGGFIASYAFQGVSALLGVLCS